MHSDQHTINAYDSDNLMGNESTKRDTAQPKQNEPKGHHLVPQFYLRRFSEGKAEKIMLVDRNDLTRSVRTSVENAIKEKYFYSVETDTGRDPRVEKMFAEQVEGPAARALRRIVDDRRPTTMRGLRRQMSTFIAFQCVRGAATRNANVEFFKAMALKIAKTSTPETIEQSFREQGLTISREKALEAYEFAQSGEYTVDMTGKANWHLGTALPIALHLIPLLSARAWRLLEFEAPLLVTSDEPVAQVGQSLVPGEVQGLGNARELVFALDPRHALVMVHPALARGDDRYAGSAAAAAIINKHVAFNAVRWIVRHPSAPNPLADVTLPEKADPIIMQGDYVIMQPQVSKKGREDWLTSERGRTLIKP